MRSKRISDYVEAKLSDLRPGRPLAVDLHLYFAANQHVLVWRKAGETLSERFVAKYEARGMAQIWIHRDDEAAWREYVEAKDAAEPALVAVPPPVEAAPLPLPAPAPALAAPSATPSAAPRAADLAPMLMDMEELVPIPPRTEEGRGMVELLASPELDERMRTALTARAARDVLAETLKPATPELRAEAISHARDVVRDVLDSVLEEAAADVRKTINEVWDLNSIDPKLDHAVNVASFAVLFAMAFGRISQDVLTDIALAGLLHDIGLTQIPAHVVQTPWEHQSAKERQLYARHVDEGLRLIDDLAGEMSPRVKPLIQQHHEKFDGTGYPMQLQGFQVNDVAQLVAMADTLESMSSGQWDGIRRSLTDTFDSIEKLERSRSFPEFFNPEVFSAVTRWIRAPGSLTGKHKASDIVRATTRDLMKRKA
jgi:HD-GYP domain-containing protein (c-di-GMP phosphodiesterase class II)